MLAFPRSLLFTVLFYLASVIIVVGATPLFLLPRRYTVAGCRFWSHTTLWLLGVCAGITYEVRGRENLPSGPCLIASKHQSMWDTVAATAVLDDPALVLKKELLMIPFYGWYARKMGMIAIDRGAGASAIRSMIARAKAAVAAGRSLLIYPEGTRTSPGESAEYKPGVTAIYRQLKLPCVPVAVNSGHFWPRRGFIKRPGTIVLEFLPAIPPGLDRQGFMSQLEHDIESASRRLSLEATGTPLEDKQIVPEK